MMQLSRQPLFWIGFLIILGVLSFSFYHQYVMDDKIPESLLRYDKEGMPNDTPPFSPDKINWFGTNQFGTDLFYMIVSGAKYTIGIALSVALARILFGFIGGVILSWFRIGDRYLTGSVQSFYYLPSVLLVFFIVSPITYTTKYTFSEKLVFQMIIMVLIAIPPLIVLIKDEISSINKHEFIASSRLMGGGYLHIFRKHILSHLKTRLMVIYLQQVISVLNLMAQLGVLSLFIGGTILREFDEKFKLPVSLSNEWSGLIGGYWYQLNISPWLVFFPVLAFALCILAFNCMLEGLRRALDEPKNSRITLHAEKDENKTSSTTASFQFLDKQKAM